MKGWTKGGKKGKDDFEKGKSSYMDKGGKSKCENTTEAKGHYFGKGGEKGKDCDTYQKGKATGKDNKGKCEWKGGSHDGNAKGYKGGDEDIHKGKTLKGVGATGNTHGKNYNKDGKGKTADEDAKGDPKGTCAEGKAKGKGKDKSTMSKGSKDVDPGYGGKGHENEAGTKGKSNAGNDLGKGDANQQAESNSSAKGKAKAGGKDYGKYYKGKKGQSKGDDGKAGKKGKRKADEGTEAMISSHVVVIDDDGDDLPFSFSYRPPRDILSKAMPFPKQSVILPKAMPNSSSSCSSQKRPLQTSPGDEHHGDPSTHTPQSKKRMADEESCR